MTSGSERHISVPELTVRERAAAVREVPVQLQEEDMSVGVTNGVKKGIKSGMLNIKYAWELFGVSDDTLLSLPGMDETRLPTIRTRYPYQEPRSLQPHISTKPIVGRVKT